MSSPWAPPYDAPFWYSSAEGHINMSPEPDPETEPGTGVRITIVGDGQVTSIHLPGEMMESLAAALLAERAKVEV